MCFRSTAARVLLLSIGVWVCSAALGGADQTVVLNDGNSPFAESPGSPNQEHPADYADTEPRHGAPVTGRFRFLVALSLGISLGMFLTVSLLAVAAAAAAAGVPIPLLAALPSSSAALFALQLLALASSDQGAPKAVAHLGHWLLWMSPSPPGSTLITVLCMIVLISVSRSAMQQRHLKSVGSNHGTAPPPHGLVFGAWELRAVGLLAFPLSAAATALIRSGGVGFIVGCGVLVSLVHLALTGYYFVSDVIASRRVVRSVLPATAGGAEVFVDAVCDQLRAIPVSPPRPSVVFGDWLLSPAWCAAPVVASIAEVEHHGLPQDCNTAEGGSLSWPSGSPWCSVEDSGKAISSEIEDELQGKPLLLASDNQDQVGYTTDGVDDNEDVADRNTNEQQPLQDSATSSSSTTSLRPSVWRKPSAVSLAHPVRVTTAAAYEIRAHDLVAGVSCIPWLDCAVPADVLRRLEELGDDIVLQVHPGQLSGSLGSGRWAVCFDWGTRYPLRWSAEVIVKVVSGMWAAMLPSWGKDAWPQLLHLAVLGVVIFTAFFAVGTKPFEHESDNLAHTSALSAVAIVVILRVIGDSVPFLEFVGCVAVAILVLIPCAVAFFAGIALTSTTLGRLEAQSLHDRLLAHTIAGWGAKDHQLDFEASFSQSGESGCGSSPLFSESGTTNAVEVILPGPRPAWAVLLPAASRPRVVQVQLLPPVAGQRGRPEALPPCVATADRPRLPAPPGLLFPRSIARPLPPSAPVAALLAPGRPGRLVFAEAARNEGGADWREAVHSFFGTSGSLLADEAERLVEQHTAPKSAREQECGLVIIEVLPALAAEFMDERHEYSDRPLH